MMWSRRLIRIIQTLTIVFVAFLCFTCDTEGNLEPQVAFIKYYGGEGNQVAVDLHVNSDGTIILLGTTINNGTSNIYLVKTDQEGNVLRTATFGNGTDVARDIEPTFDGDLVVLARTRIQGVDSVKLLRISMDLVKLDSVIDGFPGKDAYPNTVTAVEQHGLRDFVVTGSTKQTGPSTNSLQAIMHLRYDNNLNPYSNVWERIRDAGINQPVPITQFGVRTVALDDNRLYVMSYSNAPKNGVGLNYNVFYFPLKFDEDSGGLVSGGAAGGGTGEVTIGTATEDTFGALASTDIAVGTVSTAVSGGIGQLIFSRFPIYTRIVNLSEQVKELGNPIHTTLATGSSTNRNFEAVNITAASGGGYYIVANQIELDNTRNIWVSKIDEAGNIRWSSNFGAKENDDRGAGVGELPNGRVVALGTMNLENQDKLALINLNGSGRLSN